MASIFPGSPSLNDIFTSNGTTWQWNGEAWTVVASDGQTFTNVITSPSSQTITADSPTDTLTIAAGTNISVSGNSSNDTLTISSTIDTQNLINTASAAAYTSASGYTNFIVDGLDTLDIEENTNLYFTSQRAIDATSSLITSASANALSQANTYSNSASANALAQANSYTNSASAAAYASASAYTVSQINALTTSDIEEGTNLYFTNERAINAGSATYLTQAAYASASPNFATDAELANKLDTSTYASASANFATDSELASAIVTASAAAVAYADSLTTADVAENTNLYFTNERAINAGSATYLTQAAYASASPNFATDAELASAIVTASAAAVAYADGLTTTDVVEGTNLYFTNERAVNAGSATYILQTSQQGIINSASAAAVTAVIDGAPGALDTLNELAAALGDDQNFATSVTNSLSAKLDISTASATYLTQAAYASASPNFATDAELANKLDTSTYASASANFATDSELASAIVTASAAAVAYADSLTTADVAENTNLYFTNERAINAGSATYLTQAAYASASPNFATDAELASAIVTASAAAVAYADGLTTTDVAEGTSLYYTNARGQQTASTMFVHGNHTNVSAQYVSGEIRLTSSAAGGGGGATVAYQTTQPDTSALDAGSLWIDSDQDAISGLLPATFTRWVKVLSASATTISGLDDNVLSLLYTPGYEKVFINGTLLVRGSDYTASTGNTVVLTVAAETTDVIEIHSYESFQIADTYTQAAADAKFFPINESRVDRWTKTYSASATIITGTDDYSESLLYTSGLESLFINGVLVDPSEYTRTSASVITPDEAILSGDVVDIISPKAFDVANTYTIGQIDAKYNNRTRWTKTYSASATVISGVDDNANTLSYTSGYEEVYLNGILLTPITDYARTSASVITLGAAVVTSDIIDVVNIQPFNVADVYTEAESDAKYLTQVSASSTYQTQATNGMVLLNTTTFTAQSTVSVDNVFSSTYDNYLIEGVVLNTVDARALNLRLRVSGTDASGANYNAASFMTLIANPTSYSDFSSGTGQTFITLGGTDNLTGFVSVNISNPNKVNQTAFLGRTQGNQVFFSGGRHTLTTQYTGFSIFPSANNLTGSISVYGIRK